MLPIDTTSAAGKGAAPAPARPGWVGFRWGMAAGGLFAALVGGIAGYFGTVLAAESGEASLAELVPTMLLFFLPSVLAGLLLGGLGGAMTLALIHWVLQRRPGIGRGAAVGVAVAICLLILLLLATPALLLLYTDGNFWRGLEESLIFGIPFYFVPGLFYILAMSTAILRHFTRWFPARVSR